jgi:dipeptidyl aminopeptidase/acylaminoacyl peptidase
VGGVLHRLSSWLVPAALFLAACAGSEAAPGPGRLVILDGAGDVVVIDRDGSNPIPLSEDAGAITYFQPVWDPSASTVAVSRIAPGGEPQLVLRDLDAAAEVRVPLASFAFYVSWSPDGSRLGLLGNAPGGLRFDVFDAAGDRVDGDEGQPYYFSWEPEGSRLVAHVGVDRLDVQGGDPGDFALGAPGLFRAPQWTEDGILYLRGGAQQALVRAGAGGTNEVLAELPGGATFSVSPVGERVAVQSIGGNQDGLSVRMLQAPILPAQRLVVLDLSNGEWQGVGDAPAVAFWWSPDGTALLVLTVAEDGPPLLEWSIWQDGTVSAVTEFRPDPSFARDLLPFFDQYAQSMSLWAPDSSAFAFPGRIDGEEGIWVVPREGAPTLVAEGTWAAWSPR